ncbi:hypothetical protein [Streptococcus suis]|uniref:hypothetical protein n=1 Tax=Streptococcus suis TaxID=1307 RepID=UPI0014782380
MKHIRLKSKGRNTSSHIDRVVSKLYQEGRKDFACFKIINDFFDSHRDNDESLSTIQVRLDRLKKEQEIINDFTIDNDCFLEIKQLVLSLFENPAISNQDYRMIYSYYLEYLTMQWKKIPGRHGKVVFEPLIKHKRRELFSGKEFANSKCDVVYKNTKEKVFSVYECKFGLITFFSHLRIDTTTSTGKQRKNGIRAQRKIQYLKECSSIFSPAHSDVLKLEVKIVTLATRSSIQGAIHLLDGIDLITREDIEDVSFYKSLH